MKTIKRILTFSILFFCMGAFSTQVIYANPADYSFPELLERYGSTDEILRQLELYTPVVPIMPYIDFPPIEEVIDLETKYIDDGAGNYMEVYTDETLKAIDKELRRRSDLSITPEFEAYADELAARADIMMAIAYYEYYGYVPTSPTFFYNDIRRVANILDEHDGLTLSQRNTVNSTGLAARNLANSTSRPSGIPNAIDNNAWRDAFRHFEWNRNMARNMNQRVARIAGNNHEWAGIIGTANRSNSQMIEDRRRIAQDMTRSQTAFNSRVDNDTLMDFWNNRAGVNNSNLSGTSINVFNTVWNRGQLIGTIWNIGLPRYEVTSARRSDIFNSRWFIHF